MSQDDCPFDLAQVLQFAVLARSAAGFRTVGQLPPWWSSEVGLVEGNFTSIVAPFLREFVDHPPSVWQACEDGIEASQIFTIEHDGDRHLQLQALAICSNGSHWLLLRNLSAIDDWLVPILTAARRNKLAQSDDRRQQQKQVFELTADRDEAKRMERIQGEFLANMSHEVRTPLTTIIGLVDLALKSETADPRRHLKLIRDAAKVLERLSNDILDLSRLQTARLQLAAAPFSIREFMSSFADEWQLRAEASALRFETHVANGVPETLFGDAFRLRQVLANLVGNAFKFTHEGSVSVRVQLADDGSDQISFSVVDTGIGIPVEQLTRVFDPFSQVDTPPRRQYQQGVGLGLTIASNLVRLMQGTLHVDSEVGRGTRFLFQVHLPHHVPLSYEEPEVPIQCPPKSGETKQILVAEDHDINRMIIVDTLASAGHETVEVNNGQAAVDAWRDRNFDVVLMDCQMPIMSGLEAIRTIRDEERATCEHVPIVALTAHALRDERVRILDMGADAYLAKPFESADLLALVARLSRK